MKWGKIVMVGRIFLFSVLMAASLVAFPSCALHDAKAPTPMVRMNVPSSPPANAPPYCKIDFNCPLSAAYNPRLYVYKTERRLLVVENGVLIRDYHIGLGPHPSGDKCMQGDGRTPEGEFFVCVKNPASKYYKSLGLSYPGPKHAQEAIQFGAISPDEYQEILRANENKGAPPWNTALGGAIFIHGGGAYEDWTLGCIAVNNSAMDELFEVIPVGTPVNILP